MLLNFALLKLKAYSRWYVYNGLAISSPAIWSVIFMLLHFPVASLWGSREPINLRLSENFVEKFCQKWKIGAPNRTLPHSGKFVDKIRIMSTHSLLCWKIAAICQNFDGNF